MRLYWLLRDPKRVIIGWLTVGFLVAVGWIFYSVLMFVQGQMSPISVGLGVPLATILAAISIAGRKYLH